MRYFTTEGAYILSKFPTGSTVNITLYKLLDGSIVTISSSNMTEIATTGVFKWHTSNIETQPTVYTEYLFIATDNVSSYYGKFILTPYDINISNITEKIVELHELQGLVKDNPMVVNKLTSKRSTNNIQLDITDNGNTTTVSRL